MCARESTPIPTHTCARTHACMHTHKHTHTHILSTTLGHLRLSYLLKILLHKFKNLGHKITSKTLDHSFGCNTVNRKCNQIQHWSALAKIMQLKCRRRIWKKWRWMDQEGWNEDKKEVPGSGRSIHGYILTYSRWRRLFCPVCLWVLSRGDHNFRIHSTLLRIFTNILVDRYRYMKDSIVYVWKDSIVYVWNWNFFSCIFTDAGLLF